MVDTIPLCAESINPTGVKSFVGKIAVPVQKI